MRRRRLAIVVFVVLLALAGELGRRAYRSEQQIRLSTPLFVAASNGDAVQIRTLLAQGANPNLRAAPGYERGLRQRIQDLLRTLRHGRSSHPEPSPLPLVFAARAGYLDVTTALLDGGANPNARDETGNPVLLLAIRDGNLEIAETLVAHGAAVNVRDDQAMTPLLWALRWSDSHLARELLDHGADVHVQDKDNRTPLILATFNQDTDLIAPLLAHGADTRAHDNAGLTALAIAQAHNDQEAVRLLERAGP